MSEEKENTGQPQAESEKKPRFSQEQYDMLLRCSKKKDVTEWNEWRKKNPDEEIWLEGADLSGANLNRANLWESDLRNANIERALLGSAIFARANLGRTNLEGAILVGAIFEHAILEGTNLERAILQETNFLRANIIDVNLIDSSLRGANFGSTNIVRANFGGASLGEADFRQAYIENVKFIKCNVNHTDFSGTYCDGADFTGCVFIETITFGWNIKNVKCDYIYLDKERKNRLPKDRNFEPGEFEKLYQSLPTIEYVFEKGMKWFDTIVMDQIAQEINPEYKTELLAIDSRGLFPRAIFSISSSSVGEEVLRIISAHYEEKIQLLEADKKYFQEMCRNAFNAIKELKTGDTYINRQLVTHGDSYYSERDMTVIQITPEILDKIIEVIQSKPAEAFDKKPQKEVINFLKDIGKDLTKDGAKGAAKYTGKVVWEKLKPMLPIALHTVVHSILMHGM